MIFRILFFSILLFSFKLNAQENSILDQIQKFPEVVSAQKIEQYPFFTEAYEILIEQYLDHGNPSAGKFNQRILFSHYNEYSPIVMVTEGYRADNAAKANYVNELSKIIEANQIVVEHRYFGKSKPNDINWEYLTLANATADLHRIQKLFKRLYNHNNKWLATGISKGGQTTMAYKAYYPNDMDIWIPYVAPLNYGIEDGRHENFLEKVGSKKCRNSIQNFQIETLKRRDEILPMLDSVIMANHYTFETNSNVILDYCVLEYSFAFWQWGYDCSTIPSDSAKTMELFNHLLKISPPEYFSHQGMAPIEAFFVMAAKEMGYYGYNTKPFHPFLAIDDAKGYFDTLFLDDNKQFKFNKKTSKFINKTIQKDGEHVLFIYGENDPWTASKFTPKSSCDAVIVISPQECHKARISNLPIALKKDVYMTLETWLEED